MIISPITGEALRTYLAWRVAQILDLKEAIAAADRGEFASDDQVNDFFWALRNQALRAS